MRINQLLLCWLIYVTLSIASFKLHLHKNFEEQRGKIKLKMTAERAEGERKGRKDEFSDEFWKQMGNDWGTEIHCSCRNSSEQIIKSSPSSTVTLSFLENPAAFFPSPSSQLSAISSTSNHILSLEIFSSLLSLPFSGHSWEGELNLSYATPLLPDSANPGACPLYPRTGWQFNKVSTYWSFLQGSDALLEYKNMCNNF